MKAITKVSILFKLFIRFQSNRSGIQGDYYEDRRLCILSPELTAYSIVIVDYNKYCSDA